MPEEVRIRRAGAADAPVLGDLNAGIQRLHATAMPDAFRQPDPAAAAEFFRRQAARDEVVMWLAETTGAQTTGVQLPDPVGYLMAEETRRGGSAFTMPADVLYIHHIYVVESVRRGGVGRALIAAADAAARERGLSGLRLDYWSFNEAAGRFFAAQGFAADNIRMGRPTT